MLRLKIIIYMFVFIAFIQTCNSSKLVKHIAKSQVNNKTISNSSSSIKATKKVSEVTAEIKIIKPTKHVTKTRGYQQLKSIYDNFESGQYAFDDHSINSVRYIPSSKVEINNKTYYIFNLSLISQDELLKKAELYIYEKRSYERLVFNLHFFLFQTSKKLEIQDFQPLLSNTPAVSLEIINTKYDIYRRKSHWKYFNIYETLNSYINIRNERERLKTIFNIKNDDTVKNQLILFMEARIDFKKKIKEKGSIMSSPYLFTYGTQDIEALKQFFSNRVFNSDIFKSDDLNGLRRFETQVDISNRQIENKVTTKSKNKNTNNQDNVKSLNYNKIIPIIPQTDDKKYSNYRSKVSKASSSLENSVEKFDQVTFKTFSNRNVRSIEDNYENIENITNNQVGNLESINSLDYAYDYSESILPTNLSFWNYNENIDDKSKYCRAVPMTVDFYDLSFSEWIIEPKSFQSNYCSGTCKFSSTEQSTFSNYATIQSILNSIKLTEVNIPSPVCCSASKTLPLAILYKDINTFDYVVKLLPDMIVSSCSCR